MIVTEPQVSLPEAVPVLPGAGMVGHSSVTAAGQVIDGGVVSRTVIVCAQVLLFRHESVAFHVRVIVPVYPHAGANVSLSVMVTVPQVSLPVAVPLAPEVVSPVHSTVLSAGQVIEGAFVSITVIVCTQCDAFPQRSAAENVRFNV